VPKPPPTNLRIDASTLERFDVIAAALSARAEGANVTRSDAARAVIAAGLPVVEAKLGIVTAQAEEKKPARKSAK
jgi:hypothetical protein